MYMWKVKVVARSQELQKHKIPHSYSFLPFSDSLVELFPSKQRAKLTHEAS